MTTTDLRQFGELLVETVSAAFRRAGAEQSLGSPTGKTGAGGDETKRGDSLSEEVILATIREAYAQRSLPPVLLVTEELGVVEIGTPTPTDGILLVLDPIDGSPNLRPWATPDPFVAVSLGMANLSRVQDHGGLAAIEVGIVRDIFHANEFVAVRGEGAWFNSTVRLRSSRQTNLDGAVVGVSLDGANETFDKRFAALQTLLRRKAYQRRLGSTVLDLSRVATGDYDAYVSVKGKTRIHDLAAVVLLIEEAGGTVLLREHAAETSGAYLRTLADTKDGSILAKTTFDVIAAGTHNLSSAIRDLVWYTAEASGSRQ